MLIILVSCTTEKSQLDAPFDIGRTDLYAMVDGEERHVAVHVPENYDKSKQHPVVFMLHGSGGSGEKFYNISGCVGKAEQEGIIAVFPTALQYALTDGSVQTKWSSDGLLNILQEGVEMKDDKIFIQYIVDELKASLNVDASRLYICGFSNGSGFVKSEIVPNMSNVFAAANATGGVGIPILSDVIGNRTMPVFNISGTMDAKIFEQIGDNTELPLSGPNLEEHEFLWDKLSNMCEMMGLENTYTESPNPPAWNELIFTDQLSASSAAEYRFVMVKEMTHVFPNGSNNSMSVRAVDILWPWFMQWTL